MEPWSSRWLHARCLHERGLGSDQCLPPRLVHTLLQWPDIQTQHQHQLWNTTKQVRIRVQRNVRIELRCTHCTTWQEKTTRCMIVCLKTFQSSRTLDRNDPNSSSFFFKGVISCKTTKITYIIYHYQVHSCHNWTISLKYWNSASSHNVNT